MKAKLAKFICIFLKKTDKELLPLQESIENLIAELSEREREKCDSIDTVADIFGNILKEALSANPFGNQTLCDSG